MEKYNTLRLAGEQWHNNPRQITKEQFELLQESLGELGDLSGVVHDLNSNQYVGGNQRSVVFEGCEIELTETFDEPTATGTVALGYIIYQGEKYAYRQVRWEEEQCRKALILANAAGGTWDMDELANSWDDLPLFDWGVPVPKTIVELGEEEYQEKEITEPLETKHECPSCGFKY
ncbi:hypothetical protein [Hymenobacter fodinae]|uniref:Uncharacterized protein n=1 Tax=Hymenobacter fodinae TaxID=2510796 RepID=A0A4Z0P7J8_9BACT|nr:hypothetical protein [Hymenobacter fodinae]TGE08271.1 hypothetical protein EU556_11150 [Hymenobacter fodinae]